MRSEEGAARALKFRRGNPVFEAALKMANERSMKICSCETCPRCGGSMKGLVETAVETALWLASGNDPERLSELD